VGPVTRPRPKPKPKFAHEVSIGRQEIDEPWLAKLLAEIAGTSGFKKEKPFWAYTVFSFAHKEQADGLERGLRDHRYLKGPARGQGAALPGPDPVRRRSPRPARSQTVPASSTNCCNVARMFSSVASGTVSMSWRCS
jgi:hypothetical protein